MDQPAGDQSSLALGLLLFESVDELNGGEEANPLLVVLDSLDAERRGDACLAGAWTSDQNGIVGVLHELATMELANERLVDLAAGEVESAEVAVGREAGGLELIGRRPDLAFGRLGLQELRQDRYGGIEGRGPLFVEFTDRLGHAVHLEAAQHDDDGACGGIMTHGEPPRSGVTRRSARHWQVAQWSAREPGGLRRSVE